jgi:serine protease
MSNRSTGSTRFRRTLALVGAAALTAALSALSIGTASAHGTSSPRSASEFGPHYVHSHGKTVKVNPHGRFGVVPQSHSSTKAFTNVKRAPQASGLVYGGGPVQHSVSVYLVFWGSQWDSDGNGVQQYMTNLFGGLGTSSDTWSTVTSQYTDNSGSGPTFNGAVLAGSWVDDAAAAPGSAAAADIAAEAEAGVQHFGIGASTDVQLVVLSPSGTSPDGFPNSGFCAWHDYDGSVPYTNMPYVLDAGSGCGANSVQSQLDGFSIVEGHEYAETLTDPQPSSGWVDPSGQENGDLCAWQNLGTISLPTGTFAMQPTWSNAAGGCAMSS